MWLEKRWAGGRSENLRCEWLAGDRYCPAGAPASFAAAIFTRIFHEP